MADKQPPMLSRKRQDRLIDEAAYGNRLDNLGGHLGSGCSVDHSPRNEQDRLPLPFQAVAGTSISF